MEIEEPEVKVEKEKVVKKENQVDPSKESTEEKSQSDDKNIKKPIQDNYEPEKISEFELINQDPSLKNYEWAIKRRMDHYKNNKFIITKI